MRNSFTYSVKLLPLFRREAGRGASGRALMSQLHLFEVRYKVTSNTATTSSANARMDSTTLTMTCPFDKAQDDMQTLSNTNMLNFTSISTLPILNFKFLIFNCLLLAFSACDPPIDTKEVTDLPIGNDAVMFVNEGNYTYGNASISYYNPLNGSFYEDIYQTQNGRPLGDVAQSMVGIGSYGYIVVNNSNKIEVVDLLDFKNVASITGLTSPRYILPLGDGRAYVSDIYGDELTIINTNTNTIIGNITLPGWTEQMVLTNSSAYVANYDSMRVEVIDPATHTKTTHIPVDGHPMEMVLDAQGQVWVMGQKEGSDAAALTRINPTNNTAELTLNFPHTASPSHLVADATGANLYYISNEGVYSLASTATSLPTAPIIAKNSRNYYAIGIAPDNQQLFAADALDFNQRSDVYIFNLATLTEQDTLKGGIITGGFYFYPR